MVGLTDEEFELLLIIVKHCFNIQYWSPENGDRTSMSVSFPLVDHIWAFRVAKNLIKKGLLKKSYHTSSFDRISNGEPIYTSQYVLPASKAELFKELYVIYEL